MSLERRPIRYGMVGGGPDAFIGAVHRMAARLDGAYRLCAGAFASTPERSRETGRALGLDPARVYGSFREMAEAEAGLPPEERIEVVSIVTPNHLHHPVACAFLERGFHVICDKPLATTVEDADDLVRRTAAGGRVFCVTYNYTGYPLVKEARERVRGGALGLLRRVVVEYAQGWLRTLLEEEGQKQAAWRADAERGGPSAVLGDIGSHAYDLVRYVTGLDARRVRADLGRLVPGRRADDDAVVLLELDGGVRAVLMASQVATGERNHLRLRVYGEEGALDWCQERPGELALTDPSGARTRVHDGGDLCERARAHSRLPAGHPEGFIEAFANLYRNVAATLRPAESDRPFADDFPTVVDGAHGVHFIDAAVSSHHSGSWTPVHAPPAGPEHGSES